VPFSSLPFLLGFLPCALAGYAIAARFGAYAARGFLMLASVLFYAMAAPSWLWLLAVSVLGNAGLVRCMRDQPRRGWIAAAGVALNLGLLAWGKFAAPTLPLGISFFTFTQIGCLLWAADPSADRLRTRDHLLLALFFPALIAGPILTPRDMLPQLSGRTHWALRAQDLSVGAGFLILGLVKKTLLADPLQPLVIAGFADPDAAGVLTAWRAALAWSLQLYFDFSGYTDMAIGLAWMFGFRFPDNFDQPYRAASVISYWQCWHMSLTRFLMAHLHAPLTLAVLRRRRKAGAPINEAGQRTFAGFTTMIAVPIVATMLLAGLWHGATWGFLLFGVLHAGFLLINHAWRIWRAPALPRCIAVLMTYGAVLIAAVVFRADRLSDALSLLAGMLCVHGIGGQAGDLHGLASGDGGLASMLWIGMLFGLVWFAPTTRQFMTGAIAAPLSADAAQRSAHPAGVSETGGSAFAPAWFVRAGFARAGFARAGFAHAGFSRAWFVHAWFAGGRFADGWRWQPSPAMAISLGGLGALGLLACGGTQSFVYFSF